MVQKTSFLSAAFSNLLQCVYTMCLFLPCLGSRKRKKTSAEHSLMIIPTQYNYLQQLHLFIVSEFVNFLWKYGKQKAQKSQVYTELHDFHQCNQCSDKNTKQNITSMQQLYFIFLTNSPASTRPLGFVVSYFTQNAKYQALNTLIQQLYVDDLLSARCHSMPWG